MSNRNFVAYYYKTRECVSVAQSLFHRHDSTAFDACYAFLERQQHNDCVSQSSTKANKYHNELGNKTGPGKSCVAVTESKPKLILETDKNLD